MKRIRVVMTAKTTRIKMKTKKAIVVKKLLKEKIKMKIVERVMGRLIIAQNRKRLMK